MESSGRGRSRTQKLSFDRAAAVVVAVAFAAVVAADDDAWSRCLAPLSYAIPTLRLFLREELTAEEYFILAKMKEKAKKRDARKTSRGKKSL